MLRDRPGHLKAWLGLGEVYSAQGRQPEFRDALSRLAALPGGGLEATLLEARSLLSRREFARARMILGAARAERPDEVAVLVHLSHALLEEDHDHAAAEAVLEDVLGATPAPRSPGRTSRCCAGGPAGRTRRSGATSPWGCSTARRATRRRTSALLPALYALARQAAVVTLSGAGDGGVVEALFARGRTSCRVTGAPPRGEADRLPGLRGSTDLRFEAGVPWRGAGPTDLLVIDARRDAERLAEQLRCVGDAARVVAVLGTAMAAEGGEVDRAVVAGFVEEGVFRVREVREEGAGLSVLERV